jgi:DNA polymerase-3 subunit alpha
LDPLRYGLIFERFYNAGRETGLPDIDIDFPTGDRDKIKVYLEKRWGKSHVATIGTVMTLKPKAAIRRSYKAMGIKEEEQLALTRIVNKIGNLEILGSDSISWAEDDEKTVSVMGEVGYEIFEYAESLSLERQQIFYRWLDFLEKICSRVAGYGVHPSGVVVSDVPLDEELPCMWSADQETAMTMFPMADVAKRQFLKNDILGLRNLDVLAEWEKISGEIVDWSKVENYEYPEEMWELLDKGLTLGIFQIEKENFPKQLCKQIRPRSLEDLATIVALNRPGPIRSGVPDVYIKRLHGIEPIKYDDPIFEDILKDTLGTFLFQESVIFAFQKLGYSLQDADGVRSILGKKSPEGMQRLYRGEGEWAGKGYLEVAKPILGNKAQPIFEKLANFSLYSFGKAHSTSYGKITLMTLIAKWKNPAAFTMALIKTSSKKKVTEKAEYVREGRRLGFDVYPPDILISGEEIAIGEDGNIYFGLGDIKGIGPSVAKYIISLREKYGFNTKEGLEEAVEAEGIIWEGRDKTSRRDISPRTRINSGRRDILERAGVFDAHSSREASEEEKIADQRDLLGISLKRTMDTYIEGEPFSAIDENGEACIVGIIADIKITTVKKDGSEMGIIEIEGDEDSISAAAFPREWASHKAILQKNNTIFAKIRSNSRGYQFVAGREL